MKINKILLAAIVLVSASCKKGFLDQVPKANISNAEYWKSANDLKLYANGYYDAPVGAPSNYNTTLLPSFSGYNQAGNYGEDADQGSDNMISIPYNPTLNSENVVPASGGGWDWAQLRTINYFMANYQKVTDKWDNVKPYVGETLFFRALFYFNRLKNFGNLPWVDKPLTNLDTQELFQGRQSRNVIVDHILEDLDKAIEYLPSNGSGETFRINKEVAMLFQSRVALYEGTWEKYHAGTPFGVSGQDGTKYLQKAASVAKALIDNPHGYQLDNAGMTDGYWKLFNQTDYSSSKEVMLWRKFDNSMGLSQRWYLFVPIALQRGITKSLVDDYLCKDGKPIAASTQYQGDNTLANVVANRDPRLQQTVFVPGTAITTNRANGAANVVFARPDFTNSANVPTGYELYKGHNTDALQQVENSTQALIYFRFAEVLLNYAEAKAELGAITQADLDVSVNLLRNRVGMTPLSIGGITTDPNWKFPSLSPIINEVRRERRVELACEGFRHDDIYRWAAGGILITNWKPKGAKLAQWATMFTPETLSKYPTDANGYIEPFKNIGSMANGYQFKVSRDYLWPLPSDQLVLNPKLGPNNPGW